MTLKLITAPAAEPVTTDEAKLHLRVTHSADDALIATLVSAARQHAEHLMGRSIITQTWERVLDAFPAVEIKVGGSPAGPVAAITSVSYTDTAGATAVLDPADYTLDDVAEPGFVLPSAALSTWPATYDTVNAVRVRFTAGFGASGAAVPGPILAYIKLRVGTLYKFREDVAAGVSVADLPGHYSERLLDPFRAWGA
jgi:uncharacterized phiE125 gp8 family phage protein